MPNFHAIPIRNELRGRRGSNLDIATRILSDVHAALAVLVAEDRASVIDLRQVPHMTAETYAYLREQLGTGEVTAAVVADFRVDVSETAVPGVWWVTHRDSDGETVTEIIEITQVPAILRASRPELRAGIVRLAAQLPSSPVAPTGGGAMEQDRRNAAAEEVEG